jgi:FAD/FMN-containing dehydrogenase
LSGRFPRVEIAFSAGCRSLFADVLLRACERDATARIIGAMNLTPPTLKDLTRGLSHAFALGEKVEDVDLRALSRVVEHTPEDLTVTVESGITLAALQSDLAKQGQWLPVDPPNADALTVEGLLATNASGPRRYGYGTIRDYVIGIKVALADGRVIKSGGKVVKNVAGYDLVKLFIGSQRSLGVIAEATFKLRPLPETERIACARCESLEKAGALIESVLDSEMVPVALDLHNQREATNHESQWTLVLGFAGTREETEEQLTQARARGINESCTLDYDRQFRASGGWQRRSVLPSQTVETIRSLKNVPFVARAGNGVVYYRGGPAPPKADLPAKLTRRLKDAFDPKRILPEL